MVTSPHLAAVLQLPMSSSALPAPFVPPEVDLRDFAYIPVQIARLKQSKAWLICKKSPEFAFYMLNLWMASWHQIPASSLEDDEDVLADFAICPPRRWKAIRANVMRGWIKCSDGRLYHPVVAEIALGAWAEKVKHRAKTKHATEAREQRRNEERAKRESENSRQRDVVRDVLRDDERDVVRDVHQGKCKGEGEGECKGEGLELLPSPDGEGALGVAESPRIPDCPHQQIIALYHEVLPTLPHVREWTDARRRHLQARWRGRIQKGKYRTLDDGLAWWRRFFEHVGKSKFLCGQAVSVGKPPFVADLSWLINAENFAKVIEGKYHGDE